MWQYRHNNIIVNTLNWLLIGLCINNENVTMFLFKVWCITNIQLNYLGLYHEYFIELFEHLNPTYLKNISIKSLLIYTDSLNIITITSSAWLNKQVSTLCIIYAFIAYCIICIDITGKKTQK